MADWRGMYETIKTYIWSPKNTQPCEAEPEDKSIDQKKQPLIWRINRIHNMLESSIYDDQESRHIALLYSKLIKSYPEFKAGLFVPDEHAGYGQKDQLQKTSCFTGELRIEVIELRIDCRLTILIVLPKQTLKSKPVIYIRNPKPKRIRPSSECCMVAGPLGKQSYRFNAVYGGVRVYLPSQHESLRNDGAIVQVVQWLQQQLLPNHFPFCEKLNDDQFNTFISKAHLIKERMRQSALCSIAEDKDTQKDIRLQKIQTLDILLKCIQSENEYLKHQNRQMQQTIKTISSLNQDSLPEPIDDKSAKLLDILSEIEALTDLQNVISFEFDSGRITLDNAMRQLRKIYEMKLVSRATVNYCL